MRPLQVVVLAKAPVPGQVKTRLCPPCTPEQAARVAAAALADTLTALSTVSMYRTLVLHGDLTPPPGWLIRPQRGAGLGERLIAAFADTARVGTSTLLVGMDTPQLTIGHVRAAAAALENADAALGPAVDGGWWGLALRDPDAARALRGVPMSTADTGALTREALRGAGLRVATLPELRDVDTAADAHEVAGDVPGSRFATTVRDLVPR